MLHVVCFCEPLWACGAVVGVCEWLWARVRHCEHVWPFVGMCKPLWAYVSHCGLL